MEIVLAIEHIAVKGTNPEPTPTSGQDNPDQDNTQDDCENRQSGKLTLG